MPKSKKTTRGSVEFISEGDRTRVDACIPIALAHEWTQLILKGDAPWEMWTGQPTGGGVLFDALVPPSMVPSMLSAARRASPAFRSVGA